MKKLEEVNIAEENEISITCKFLVANILSLIVNYRCVARKEEEKKQERWKDIVFQHKEKFSNFVTERISFS